MANYSNLKAAIAAAIKTNGNQEITGQVLQDVLTSMVSVIGANYTFAGVATPSTNPGTPDQNVVYMASQAGTYTNFGGIELPAGISLLMWNGSWTSKTVMCGDGGVFDISVYKSSGGTLATFADISAALDGGNNIPASARNGGMSVKFVQSSDNKYVQYFLKKNVWSVNKYDWEKINIEDEFNQIAIQVEHGNKIIFDDYYNNTVTLGSPYYDRLTLLSDNLLKKGERYHILIKLDTNEALSDLIIQPYSTNNLEGFNFVDENISEPWGQHPEVLTSGYEFDYVPTEDAQYLGIYATAGINGTVVHTYIYKYPVESLFQDTALLDVKTSLCLKTNYHNRTLLGNPYVQRATVLADCQLQAGTEYTIVVRGSENSVGVARLYSTNNLSEISVIDENISPRLNNIGGNGIVFKYTPTKDVRYLGFWADPLYDGIFVDINILSTDMPMVNRDVYKNTTIINTPTFDSFYILTDYFINPDKVYRITIKTDAVNLASNGIFTTNNNQQLEPIQENIIQYLSDLPNVSTIGYSFNFRPCVSCQYLGLFIDTSLNQGKQIEISIQDISVEQVKGHPKYIIVDGDLDGDIDDILALRYLVQAEKNGDIILAGLNCSTRRGNEQSNVVERMDEVLTYEGANDVCIGVDKDESAPSSESSSNYLSAFGGVEHHYTSFDDAEDSVVFYKRLLNWIPANNKAILYTMGGYSSICRLWDDKDGKDLFIAKVEKVVCCGGWFQGKYEYNFNINRTFTRKFLSKCPVPLIVCGFELMGQFEVGASLGGGTFSWDLMQHALAYFNDTTNFDGTYQRTAGDACVAVLVANDDNGLSNIKLTRGTIIVDDSGNSTFTQNANGNCLLVEQIFEYVATWTDYYKAIINARLTRQSQGHHTGNGKRLPRV